MQEYTPMEKVDPDLAFSDETQDEEVRAIEEGFEPENEDDITSTGVTNNFVPASKRPTAASLLAIAMSDPQTDNGLTMLNERNLQASRDLLDSQQEQNARMRIAGNRAVDTLKFLDTITKEMQESARDPSVDQSTMDYINEVYTDVTEKNLKEASRIALELETIDRIRTYMVNDDIHEAYIARDQFYGDGNADKRIVDHMTKVMIASQRLEELQAEYEDSGWVRGFFNGVLRAIPSLDMFSASGITNDAGITDDSTSLLKFIMAGSNLKDQRESLWGLSPEEFAKALDKDGPLMQAIRENASWLMADPARAQEIGGILLSGQEDDKAVAVENFFGGLDAAFVVGGAVGRVGKTLSKTGARRAARDQTAKAIREAIENGPDAARAATGIGGDELLEAMTMNAHRAAEDGAVPLAGDVADYLATLRELKQQLPDIISANQFDSVDEILAAFQVKEKELLEGSYGSHIKNVEYKETNLNSNASRNFGDDPYVSADGANVYTIEVTLGKKTGGGYAKEGYVKGLFDKFGREGKAYQDPDSGQWFGKIEVNVPLDGFITSELKTPKAWFSFLRSSTNIADGSAVAKGVVAGNAANRFLKTVENVLKQSVKGIPRSERKVLNEVLKKGQNEAKWYSPEEFSTLYQRTNPKGEFPSKEMQTAYSTYRLMSDIAWTVRNDALYLRKAGEGFESHVLRIGGRDVDVDAVLNRNPQKFPAGHTNNVWDANRERFIDPKETNLKDMADEGYVMLRLDEPVQLPNGRLVTYTMVKEDEIVSRPLRRAQLNYSQGGSRAYDATHYIKQAAEDVDGNLVNPKTHIAGSNLNEMKLWASDMNEAIRLYKEGETDPLAFDDIFKYREGYPSGEEFLEMVENRTINIKHKFEVVESGKTPSQYFGKDPESLRFVDMDELEIDSYYRTTGQMYYGTKGEHLKDTTGKFAETIDPWETLNATINEAARVYSFRGYKENVAARFNNTYKNYLDMDRLGETNSLYGIAHAKIRNDVPENVAALIRQEQAAIRRLMNFETEFEKSFRTRWTMAAEAVLGDAADDSIRAAMRRGMINLQEKNPVQFLRTLAFDANLGFFNIGQLFIQTSTMLSAMALDPRHGLKAANPFFTSSMKAWALKGYDDNLLDVLAKKGAWKGSFDSEADFKEYARLLRDSNLYEVSGHNLAMIREYGANKIFGASSAYDAIAEKGRMFFYFAEQMNRTVSSRIAYGLLKERGVRVGTAEFTEQFAKLTDDYSFNMMSQTSAGFQHGIWSIPTQFWAYSFRMMDALLGKKFTPAQKARLLLMNFAMGGALAVPGGALIKEMYQEMKGEPVSIEDADGWAVRGLYDGLAYLATGADVNIGERIATGDLITNVVRDIFGQGEYGEKSLAQMFLGATGGKLGSALPTLAEALEYSAYEVLGHEAGNLAPDAWLKMANEVASFRGAHRAYIAHRYNEFYSRNGALVDSDLPEASAIFLALTFTPATEDKLSFYFNGEDDAEMIKEAATQLSNWRQQAFTRPDTREENMRKAAALMSLYPPHIQVKIRQRAREVENVDMYSVMKRRFEKDVRRNEFIDEMVPMIEEEVVKGQIENAE